MPNLDLHLVMLCLFGVTVVLAILGLSIGFSLEREPSKDVKEGILSCGLIGCVISALCLLVLAVAEISSPLAYEVCGTVLALGSFALFLSFGLWIGPPRAR